MPLAAFIVPASAVFRVHDGHVAVSYPGDVRIEQDFSGELSADGNVEILGTASCDVTAGGDVAIHDGVSGGTLRASGSLVAAGDVHAVGLFADVIDLRSATSIAVTSIRATTAIHIGPCDLKVDIVMAPIVHIHSAATGKITLLECHNAREPLKVKGRLSVAYYESLMSDALGYLTERDVEPLPPAATELPELPEPAEETAINLDDPLPDLSLSMEPLDLDDAESNDHGDVNLDEIDELNEHTHKDILQVVSLLDSIEPSQLRAQAEEAVANRELEEIDDLEAIVDLDDVEESDESSTVVDLDDDDEPEESSDDPDTAQDETVDDPHSEDEDVDEPEVILDPRVDSLREAFAEVHAAYDRRDLARPAALASIQVAAQVGDVRAVSDTLDASWMELLAYHQAAGLPLPPRVVVVFQRIRTLVAA